MVRLSLLELQILVALDDRKTLTQIGRELFLKHPRVSRALHGAERKAGVVLGEQVGRRLRLTYGIEHLEEILKVPGLDVVSVGPSDLSQSYGLPGQYDHPTVKQALDRFHAAAFASGLYVNSTHPDAPYRLTSWAARIQEMQSNMPGRRRMASRGAD